MDMLGVLNSVMLFCVIDFCAFICLLLPIIIFLLKFLLKKL